MNNGTIKCWGANQQGRLGLELNKKVNIGDEPMEMGSNLPALDLGMGRTVEMLRVGENSSCAILDNDELKCWGRNDGGDLGLGDREPRGDNRNEMGDNLLAVDLGTGRTARVLGAGSTHHCAILDNDKLKCWGANAGRLGLGDSGNRGDEPMEMGDNLLALDLGMGRTVEMLAVGGDHACALLGNDEFECWGINGSGQLGLGNDNTRRNPGDALPAVELGSERTARMIFAGGNHTCAILDNDELKCWGDNGSGQLGLGDNGNRGDAPNEMGDALPAVDLGMGRTVEMLAIGGSHICALLDNDELKCWGSNSSGQLGLGDTNNRGDGLDEAGNLIEEGDPIEMGDNLPAIDLGSGRTARMIFAGGNNTCAILDNDELKCWGSNAGFSDQAGQLGQGDMEHRGDDPNEMGDNLLPIELF